MPQRANQQDIERADPGDPRPDPQPAGPTPNQPPQGESNFGDSSGPFFSIYSKAADDEDNKMVERWQKDADGILIFTGLFSAAVAALLAVTVQDLRPNSQDTSAFYLENIYQVLADPNAPRTSIPSPVPKPPPPRYAIWVNSLWFLSLVIGLTCAMMATLLHQWARRYIAVTQPARCSPEKRARMRAFYADGVNKMHVPWAVEGLPALLHLSVFLFFGGLAIFLFNIDHGVFGSVIWWIVLFSIMYGLITVMPIVRHDSPYYSPLSRSAWLLYAGVNHLLLAFRLVFCNSFGSERLWFLWEHYGWTLGGVEKAAEATVSRRSSKIDIDIFRWTIGVLGEDESLEKFFEAIPGLFKSKLVKGLETDFPEKLFDTFWEALGGFKDRTLSSNSVTESVKNHRVMICRDIASVMPCRYFPYDDLRFQFDQKPVSNEERQAMARWLTNKSRYVAEYARVGFARNLLGLQDRDDPFFALTSGAYGTSEREIFENFAHGGNAFLATLIDFSRRASDLDDCSLVGALTQFDIHDTLPRLQHDFCTLWNEMLQGHYSTSQSILRDIFRSISPLYLALHQGTDAAPTVFSASTDNYDGFLFEPSLCNIASHRPDSTVVPLPTQPGNSPDASPYPPSHGGSTVPLQSEQVNIIEGHPSSSYSTTPGGIGDTSRAPAATSAISLVHNNPRPTDVSLPGAVAAVLQDNSLAATSSHPQRRTTQRDIVGRCAEPDNNEILSSASTPAPAPALAPAPVPTLPVLNKSMAPGDAGASPSNSFLPASSVSIPASPTLTGVLPFPNSNLLPSAPLAAGIAPTRSDDLTPQIHSSELREMSQAPLVPLIPEPVPATIMPSAGPNPSDDPDMLQSITSSTYVSHPLEGNKQRDTVAPEIGEIPPTVNPIPRSTHTVSPPIFPTSPVIDHIQHAFRPSSFTTASSPVLPQVASSMGTPSSHDDIHDLYFPVPMTVSPHLDQTTPPIDDIVTATLQPEDHVQHDLDAS